MSHRRTFASLSVVALVLLLGITLGASSNAQAQPEFESITYTFTSPAYAVETDESGASTITLDGFYPYALPGDPLLPANLTHIALPPGVPLDSISIEVTAAQQTNLPGVHQITPAGPDIIAPEGVEPIEDWGPNADKIVDGRNTAIYGRNAYSPAQPIELTQASQMRKWRYVTLRFYPVSYNPITGGLRLTTQATVTIRYQPAVIDEAVRAELNDTAMDAEAAALLANYADVQAAYAPLTQAPATAPGYAIITTNQIVAASAQLTNFINHKTSLGFNVFLVTETQYNGLAGQAPNERPDKIRKWLKSNYLTKNIKYVLLIGNPDPRDPGLAGDIIGDLPMKNTWNSGPDYVDANGDRGTPTDFYFADLTGNWNKDGDSWYGDSGDYVTGGVDWAAEVYVGRIPVYTAVDGWAAALDNILSRIKTYELATDRNWRRSALLPMSFIQIYYDTAVVAENMRNDYLLDAGFSTYRMYWDDATTECQTDFNYEAKLLHQAAPTYWSNHPVGIVAMYGHGWEHGISIGWNGCAEWMKSWDLMHKDSASLLNGSKPAQVIQLSCTTGQPETWDSLAASILRYGAVSTVAAARVSYAGGTTPYPGDTGDSSMGYYYMQSIVNDVPAGRALYDAKAHPSDRWNALVVNLYGDPSVQLFRNPPQAGANVLTVGDSITFGQTQLAARYPLGDPNVDGLVTNADLTVYTNWLANPSTIPAKTTEAFKRGDADGNAKITVADKNIASDMVLGRYPRAYFGAKQIDKGRASYRVPLYQLFSAQSAYPLAFVGTVDTEKTYNYTGYPPANATYPRPTAAQVAFVGQSGKSVGAVNTGTSALYSLKPALVQLKSRGITPDVAMLHLGTVDINKAVPWATTQTQYTAILAKLRDAANGGNPAIKIYLAQVIPVGYPGGACRQNITFAGVCARYAYSPGAVTPIQTFNANLVAWCGPTGTGNVRRCANLSTAASPVYLVDQHTGFDMENWLLSADEVYPNRQGECRMAVRWYEALRATEFPNLPAPAANFCSAYSES